MTETPTILDTPNDPPEDEPQAPAEPLPEEVPDGDIAETEPEETEA